MRIIGWLIVAIAIALLVLFANRQIQRTEPDLQVEATAAFRTGHAVQLSESIEARRQVVLARLLEKDQTVKALLRGELTLDQTATRFRELICDDPTAVETLQKWYGSTGDEIYYWNVLTFARRTAYRQPEVIDNDLPQLEDEVLRRFPRHNRAFP